MNQPGRGYGQARWADGGVVDDLRRLTLPPVTWTALSSPPRERPSEGVTGGRYDVGMTRPRGDPERIYQAQRAGLFMRLVTAERLGSFDAEQWLAAWEREAEATGRERGSQGFWDEGWRWIGENRRKH